MSGWTLRDLLWERKPGSLEYVFQPPAAAGALWDPILTTATLTNANHTAAGGRAWTVAALNDPGLVWAIEIQVISPPTKFSLAHKDPDFPFLSNGTTYWAPNGDHCINYSQATFGSPDPAYAFVPTDILAMVLAGSGTVAFFRNGSLIDFGVTQYYTSPPLALLIDGGSATINGDLGSMAFGSTYAAFASSTYPFSDNPLTGWPAA